MTAKIKNFEEVAITPEREKILRIAEKGLEAINTDAVLKKQMQLNGSTLSIQGDIYDLNQYKHVYVLGFGKASGLAAEVVEEILGDKITSGIVISLKESEKCKRIKVLAGTHPLPSEKNVQASQELISVAEKAEAGDLVIVIVSGGGSALLCGTQDEFEQGQRLYKEYLKSNGEIIELNTVRKHISILKGGGLAKLVYPATLAGLVFSDIAGDTYDFVTSGPTYPDKTTMGDAQAIIDKYSLGNYHLLETPKGEKYFQNVKNYVMVSNVIALEEMRKYAQEMGLNARVLTVACYEPARQAFLDMQKECKPGELVMVGGEVRVIVTRTGGTGGRCHYIGMASEPLIKEGETFCAFASDGQDNSDSAGIIMDADTRKRAGELGMNADQFRERYDGYGFFKPLGHEQIFTGITESNVADWMFFMRN